MNNKNLSLQRALQELMLFMLIFCISKNLFAPPDGKILKFKMFKELDHGYHDDRGAAARDEAIKEHDDFETKGFLSLIAEIDDPELAIAVDPLESMDTSSTTTVPYYVIAKDSSSTATSESKSPTGSFYVDLADNTRELVRAKRSDSEETKIVVSERMLLHEHTKTLNNLYLDLIDEVLMGDCTSTKALYKFKKALKFECKNLKNRLELDHASKEEIANLVKKLETWYDNLLKDGFQKKF